LEYLGELCAQGKGARSGVGRMRRGVAVVAVAFLIAAGMVVSVVAGLQPVPQAAAAPPDPRIAAAGDIACSPADPNFNNLRGTATACQMMATSDLLVGKGYAGVLALGDDQYNGGSYSDFLASYDPTWGRVKNITHSVTGNHEYGSAGAGGYFRYFGAASGTPGEGWYSFDIGAWHIIALNSNCTGARAGCGPGSPQEQWLAADLAAHPNVCTMAMFHHGRYNSGHDGDSPFVSTLYQDLYNAGTDVVLSGHAHDYERFAPQDNASNLDTARGIRQFIVGTGGAFFTGFPGGTAGRHANSEVSQNKTMGVLEMTLHPGSYDWRFVPVAGGTFTDSGATACHAGQPAGASQTSPPYWPGWDIARGITTTSVGHGYVLDGYGALHPYAVGAFASSPPAPQGGPYWAGWDIARSVALLPNGSGGYVLDGYGGLHPFTVTGPMPPPVMTGPYWPGWDIARGVTILPNGSGGYVLDGAGGLHPFAISGALPPPVSNGDYWPGGDIARGVVMTGAHGGYVVDGWGGTHTWASGRAARPPAAQGGPYWPGWNIARGISGVVSAQGVVPGQIVDGFGGLHPVTLAAAP
jgi:hypothetical protein